MSEKVRSALCEWRRAMLGPLMMTPLTPLDSRDSSDSTDRICVFAVFATSQKFASVR
jgi:hypothetical protein